MGSVCQGIVIEELAKASICASRQLAPPLLLYYLLYQADKRNLKKYFPAMVKGEIVLAIAITEPEAVSDRILI